MTDRIRYAPAGALTLAYETFGEASNPPLVLIMGLGAQMLVWPDELCSVTVIHGDEDPLIPPEGGRDLAEHIAGARFELIHGMGHDFPSPLLSRVERVMARQMDEVEERGRRLCCERQEWNRMATGEAGTA